jgi:hypothetical protein
LRYVREEKCLEPPRMGFIEVEEELPTISMAPAGKRRRDEERETSGPTGTGQAWKMGR